MIPEKFVDIIKETADKDPKYFPYDFVVSILEKREPDWVFEFMVLLKKSDISKEAKIQIIGRYYEENDFPNRN